MSPLNSKIDKQSISNKRSGEFSAVRLLSFFSICIAGILLIAHILIINNNTGGSFVYASLVEQRDDLRESIRQQSKVTDELRVPLIIQEKVREDMIKTETIGYLRNDDIQVAINIRK